MSAPATRSGAFPAAAYEHGAERLHDAIASTCDPPAPFAERVQAALRASLALLAADPALARLLTVEPCFWGEIALRRRRKPRGLQQPFLVEPALIGGISFQISRRVLTGEDERLEDLLPGFTGFLLAYYLHAPTRIEPDGSEGRG